MSNWRDIYKVHPAADAFPMMSDAEIDDLAEHIKANGLAHPPVFYITHKPNGVMLSMHLLEGRNRVAALDRLGRLPLTQCQMAIGTPDDIPDPYVYVIAANIKRRHMTKADIAGTLIRLANIKAKQKPDQADPVSKGGRGKRNPVKEKALELNKALPKEDQVSEPTLKRAIAKSEGKTPKRRTKEQIAKDKRLHAVACVKTIADTAPGIEAVRASYLLALDRLDARDEQAEVTTMLNELKRRLGKEASANGEPVDA